MNTKTMDMDTVPIRFTENNKTQILSLLQTKMSHDWTMKHSESPKPFLRTSFTEEATLVIKQLEMLSQNVCFFDFFLYPILITKSMKLHEDFLMLFNTILY